MEVVDHHEPRLVRGRRAKECRQRLHQDPLTTGRGEICQLLIVRCVTKHVLEDRRPAFHRRIIGLDPRTPQRLRDRIPVGALEELPDELRDEEVRKGRRIRSGGRPHAAEPLRLPPLPRLQRQPALADAGLADQRNQQAPSLARFLQGRLNCGQLASAAHEPRLTAAKSRALGQLALQPPCLGRIRPALESLFR